MKNDIDYENSIKILTEDLNKYKDLSNQKDKEINDLKIQLQNKEKNIESLNTLISEKIDELNNFKNNFNRNNDNLVSNLNQGEMVISALFTSSDKKITYSIACKNTTPFVKLEEKLYKEYPEYKNTENYFLYNGNRVRRFKTIEENQIESGKVARDEATKQNCPCSAIELPDGTIVKGRTKELFGCSASMIIKALKTLANIDKKTKVISRDALIPIQELKVKYLGSKNPRLHIDEALTALSMSAATDENAANAIAQLKKLKGCDAHTTVLLSHADQKMFRKLGINLTCEPVFETKSLTHLS